MKKAKTKRGPKPSAPNAGRPELPTDKKRVRLVAFVTPATRDRLRAAGPKLGETLERLVPLLP